MTREKKYCKNCNTPLTQKAKFCSECGAKVETLEETIAISKEEIENTQTLPIIEHEEVVVSQDEQLKKENTKLRIKKFLYPIISCALTFALCLVAFAAFYKYYLENLVIETTKREVNREVNYEAMSE